MTKKNIIDELMKELGDINNLYNAKCIARRGKTNDTKDFYTEVIAHELLRNLTKFENIKPITRTKPYCRENHFNIEFNYNESNRDEEIFAKRITGLNIDEIGVILDYQIPLKNSRDDKGVGKIDLISYNKKNNNLHLIELKYNNNDETLLRAVLEAYTYYKRADKDKLMNDYLSSKFILSKVLLKSNLSDINVIPTVLVVPVCNPSQELTEMEFGKRPKLKTLSLALGIEFFTLDLSILRVEI